MKKLLFLLIVAFIFIQTSNAQYGSSSTDEEWESFFIAGVNYHAYFPDMQDSIGYFHGISVECLIATWIHKNDNHGPSHGRLYTKVNFMKSSKKDISDIYYYALGIDLSI